MAPADSTERCTGPVSDQADPFCTLLLEQLRDGASNLALDELSEDASGGNRQIEGEAEPGDGDAAPVGIGAVEDLVAAARGAAGDQQAGEAVEADIAGIDHSGKAGQHHHANRPGIAAHWRDRMPSTILCSNSNSSLLLGMGFPFRKKAGTERTWAI